MSPKSEHRENVAAIRAFYNPQVMLADTASREFSQLALKSVITLNAGVAVAFPAVLEVFVAKVATDAILWPVGIAVLGACLGVVCAYLTFHNHQREAFAVHAEMNLEVAQAIQDREDVHIPELTSEVERWGKLYRRYNKHRNLLYNTSSAVGAVSLACFVLSVLWFAIAVT